MEKVRVYSETNTPPIPQDIWVNAFTRGTAEWPQDHLVDSFRCLHVVISDPPESWGEFGLSNLSDDQISKIGNIMSNIHHSKGVKYATEEYANENDQFISVEEIIAGWKRTRDNATELVLTYISLTKMNFPLIQPKLYRYQKETAEKKVEIVNNFLKNRKNRRKVEGLKQMIFQVNIALDSDEAKDIANNWRDVVASNPNNYSSLDLAISKYRLKSQMRKVILEHITNKKVRELF